MKGLAWRSECQKAVGVWPDSVRPERSVIVPEIITGRRNAALGEDLLAGEDRRLGVERVEDRLDQNDVGAAVDQADDLLGVGVAQLVERHGAEAGIVDVGRDRGGAVGRAERAGDEAALAVDALGLQRRAAGETRAVAVELVDHLLHAVVGLGDRGRGEGVGLEDVRAGDRIGEVDVLDRLRLGQGQKVVVALEMALAADEALAAEMVLLERELLDLRAHRAVEDENALARRRRRAHRRRRGCGASGASKICGGRSLIVRVLLRHNHINISLCHRKAGVLNFE